MLMKQAFQRADKGPQSRVVVVVRVAGLAFEIVLDGQHEPLVLSLPASHFEAAATCTLSPQTTLRFTVCASDWREALAADHAAGRPFHISICRIPHGRYCALLSGLTSASGRARPSQLELHQ